jgi:hypothetical protein
MDAGMDSARDSLMDTAIDHNNDAMYNDPLPFTQWQNEAPGKGTYYSEEPMQESDDSCDSCDSFHSWVVPVEAVEVREEEVEEDDEAEAARQQLTAWLEDVEKKLDFLYNYEPPPPCREITSGTLGMILYLYLFVEMLADLYITVSACNFQQMFNGTLTRDF